MSIKIGGMKWPPHELDNYWLDKDAKEGVSVTALPGGKPQEKRKEDKEMEI